MRPQVKHVLANEQSPKRYNSHSNSETYPPTHKVMVNREMRVIMCVREKREIEGERREMNTHSERDSLSCTHTHEPPIFLEVLEPTAKND
jgi:hypothetical protein